jgi:hypothetical protein
MSNTTTNTTTMNKLPENFVPRKNQLAVVNDGFTKYYGSFTGNRFEDGSYQVFYKDICGDNCWTSTNQMEITLQ